MTIRQAAIAVALILVAASAGAQEKAQACALRLRPPGEAYPYLHGHGNFNPFVPNVTIFGDPKARSMGSTLRSSLNAAMSAWSSACPSSTYSDVPSFSADWTQPRPTTGDPILDNRMSIEIVAVDEPVTKDPKHPDNYRMAEWAGGGGSGGGQVIRIWLKCPSDNHRIPDFGCNGRPGDRVNWGSEAAITALTHEIGHSMGLDHDIEDGVCTPSLMAAAPVTRAPIVPRHCQLANVANFQDSPCWTWTNWDLHTEDHPCSQFDHPPVNVTLKPGNFGWQPEPPSVPFVTCAHWHETTTYRSSTGTVTVSHRDVWDCSVSADSLGLQLPRTGPLVAIESATVAEGRLDVAGWGMGGDGLSALRFRIDGSEVSASSFATRIRRPDVCSDLFPMVNGGCPEETGFTATIAVGDLGGGTHRLQVLANADGPPTVAEAEFQSTPACLSSPAVSISQPADGAIVSGTVDVRATASSSAAIQSVSFYVDGSLRGVDADAPFSFAWASAGLTGRHSLQARVQDGCDHTAASPTTNVTVAAPVRLFIDAPAQGAGVVGTVTVSGWATSASGVRQVTMSVDGGPPTLLSYGIARPDVCAVWPGDPACPGVGWSGTFESTALAAGVHSLAVVATDLGGQTSQALRTVLVAASGTPSVAIASPLAGSLVNGVRTIAATVGGDVGRVEFLVDGAVIGADTSAPYQVNWSTASFADGAHTVTARALGTSGALLASSVAVSATVDNRAPALWILAPASGETVSGTSVRVAGWATDRNRTATPSFAVDGNTVPMAGFEWVDRGDVCASLPSDDPRCPMVGWRAWLDSTALTNGLHNLRVQVADLAGNSTQADQPFTVANGGTQPPSVSLTAPLAGAFVSGDIAIQAATDSQGVSRVEFLVDDGLVGSDVTAPYAFVWKSTAAHDGVHRLAARVVLPSATITTGQTSVVVDNTPPALWIAAPLQNEVVSGTAVRIAGWATDANSVASLSFYVDGIPFDLGVEAAARPDVCSAVPTGDPACPNVGWRAFLDSTRLANGSRTIALMARDRAGKTTVIAVPVTIAN